MITKRALCFAIALLGIPALALAGIELALRAGAWEPYAKASSHAGTSVRVKRGLGDARMERMERIDYVTLGSSRAVYGIDHAALEAEAAARGEVHANLSMPGSHWLSVETLARWVRARHPEVRGAIVGLAISDFQFAGNGAYELAIAGPFRTYDADELARVQRHVALTHGELPSYATVSALMGYRDDVRDLLLHWKDRGAERRWGNAQDAYPGLFANVDGPGDVCGRPIDALASCTALTGDDAWLADQCRRNDSGMAALDYRDVTEANAPENLRDVATVVRSALAAARFREPTVVVLMPIPAVWKREILPRGLHQWVLHVLEPLVASGDVVLLDQTDAFVDGDVTDCTAFWDLYHQTPASRALLAPLMSRYLALARGGAERRSRLAHLPGD